MWMETSVDTCLVGYIEMYGMHERGKRQYRWMGGILLLQSNAVVDTFVPNKGSVAWNTRE